MPTGTDRSQRDTIHIDSIMPDFNVEKAIEQGVRITRLAAGGKVGWAPATGGVSRSTKLHEKVPAPAQTPAPVPVQDSTPAVVPTPVVAPSPKQADKTSSTKTLETAAPLASPHALFGTSSDSGSDSSSSSGSSQTDSGSSDSSSDSSSSASGSDSGCCSCSDSSSSGSEPPPTKKAKTSKTPPSGRRSSERKAKELSLVAART